MHPRSFDDELIIRERKAIVAALLLERGVLRDAREEILAMCNLRLEFPVC